MCARGRLCALASRACAQGSDMRHATCNKCNKCDVRRSNGRPATCNRRGYPAHAKMQGRHTESNGRAVSVQPLQCCRRNALLLRRTSVHALRARHTHASALCITGSAPPPPPPRPSWPPRPPPPRPSGMPPPPSKPHAWGGRSLQRIVVRASRAWGYIYVYKYRNINRYINRVM